MATNILGQVHYTKTLGFTRRAIKVLGQKEDGSFIAVVKTGKQRGKRVLLSADNVSGAQLGKRVFRDESGRIVDVATGLAVPDGTLFGFGDR